MNCHDEERTADQLPWRLTPGLLVASAVTTRLVAAGLLRVVPDVLADTSPGAGPTPAPSGNSTPGVRQDRCTYSWPVTMGCGRSSQRRRQGHRR